MLQKIRDKTQNWISVLIIGFLILMFGLWGISYYLSGSSADQQELAKINGQSVSINQYRVLYNYERQAASGAITAGSLSLVTLKKLVVSSLIQNQLLYQGAVDAGLGISAQSLDRYIASMPAFQSNGQFSQALYQNYLQDQGINTQGLRDRLKQTVLTNQWQLGLSESNFVLPSELENYNHLLNQTRSVQVLFIPFSAMNKMPVPVPTESELLAYYQNNLNNFRVPEKVKLDYLILNTQDLENKINISDSVAQAYYQENISSFKQKSFQAVKSNIIQHLKEQAAQEQYANLGNQLANLTFENPQSLSPAASQLNLAIQHSDWIYKDNKNLDFLNNPAVTKLITQAAFSSDVLSNGQNSDPINLSSNSVIVLRVSAHEPSEIQAFSQVKNLCIQGVEQEERAQLAKKMAADLASRTALKTTDAYQFQNFTVTRSGLAGLKNSYFLNNPVLLNFIFNLPSLSTANLNSPSLNTQIVLVPNLGYALVKLIKIIPAAPLTLKTALPLAQTLRADLVKTDYLEYLKGLQSSAVILMNPAAAGAM